MNVTLPSGHTAPLEPADLARLLACGGSVTGLIRAVWAHPELDPDIARAVPNDAMAIACWAIDAFLGTDDAAELCAVCESFGETPSQRLHVTDRTLAFRLDHGCLLSLERFKNDNQPAESQGFNGGVLNDG